MYQKKPVKIQGWEMYQVDTNGIVYSKKGRPLKYSLNKRGYCIVNFYNNHIRKGFAIHTIVATTFISHKETNNQVNHIDGDKQNNNITNLEWVTRQENVNHAINVLGKNNLRENNPNHKPIKGYDKNTKEEKYCFPTLIDAAMFFANNEHKKARHIQNIISQVANNRPHHKSYKGCIWTYNID